MSISDTSFAVRLAALQQQGLAALKETQEYALRVAELAADHPLARAARTVPATAEVVDSSLGVAIQALELQREFLGRLAASAAS
jgi:hypothetical protein